MDLNEQIAVNVPIDPILHQKVKKILAVLDLSPDIVISMLFQQLLATDQSPYQLPSLDDANRIYRQNYDAAVLLNLNLSRGYYLKIKRDLHDLGLSFNYFVQAFFDQVINGHQFPLDLDESMLDQNQRVFLASIYGTGKFHFASIDDALSWAQPNEF